MIIILFVLLIFLQLSSEVTVSKCPVNTIKPPTESSDPICYLFVDESKTFSDAEAYCSQEKGHLALQVHTHLPQASSYWIGGYTRNYTSFNVWVWTREDSLMRYTNWENSADTGTAPVPGYCTSVNVERDRWNVVKCNESKPFVCEVPEIILTYEYPCDDGWTYFTESNSCYKHFSHNVEINGTQAEAECVNEGGHLASIHSESENKFINNLISTGMYVNSSADVWIGLTTDSNGIHSWTDGTKYDYQILYNTNKNVCYVLGPDLFVNNTGQYTDLLWYYWPCDYDIPRQYLCEKNSKIVVN